jgi:hypothetical protein
VIPAFPPSVRKHKRFKRLAWHYSSLDCLDQPCDFPGGKNSIVGGLIVGSFVGEGTTNEGRFKEGRLNTGRVGTSSNAGFKATVVVGLLVGTPTELAVGATLGAATVPAMGAALGTVGTLGADSGLGALGADGTLGATGAPPDGGETGGEGVVVATLNLLQQRGIGDRPC